MPLPEPGRSEAERYIAHIYSGVTQEVTRLQLEELLAVAGLAEVGDDLTREEKKDFVDAYVQMLGPEGARVRTDYETSVSLLSTQYQYEVNAMIDQVRRPSLVNSTARVRGYLGVTEADMFSKDSNYYFGVGLGDCGVISSFRFRSRVGLDPESRPQLVRRLKKQAMSTLGFMIDIPRCADPSCARAFPNSVSAHDAKSEHPCSACASKFEAYKRYPNTPVASSWRQSLGNGLQASNRNEEAIVEFKRSTQLCSTNKGAWHNLGVSLRIQGDYASAEQALRRALEIDPENEASRITLAAVLKDRGRHEDAVRVVDGVLQSNPMNGVAQMERAGIAFAAGDKALAEKLYEKAAELNPTNTGPLNMLSSIQYNRGDYAVSLKSARCALSINSNDEYAISMMAKGLCEMGNHEAALPYLIQGVELRPQDDRLWRFLGIAYSKKGSKDDAVTAFERAAAIVPGKAIYKNDLGYTYFLKGMHKEALGYLDQATNMDPKLGIAYYNKALVYHAIHDDVASLKNLKLARDAGYPGSRRFLQAVMKGIQKRTREQEAVHSSPAD